MSWNDKSWLERHAILYGNTTDQVYNRTFGENKMSEKHDTINEIIKAMNLDNEETKKDWKTILLEFDKIKDGLENIMQIAFIVRRNNER